MNHAKEMLVTDFTRRLTQVTTALRQFIQCKLKEHGFDLTFEMLQVLGCLWNKDGINQQEIANITVKDKASMTYLIDNLTKRGLLYRQEDANDRRNKLIFLTKKGEAMKTTIQPFINEMYSVAGKGIGEDKLKSAIEILKQVERNFRR